MLDSSTAVQLGQSAEWKGVGRVFAAPPTRPVAVIGLFGTDLLIGLRKPPPFPFPPRLTSQETQLGLHVAQEKLLSSSKPRWLRLTRELRKAGGGGQVVRRVGTGVGLGRLWRRSGARDTGRPG